MCCMNPDTVEQVRRAHVFISYKRDVDPDEALANFLAEQLALAGCDVFIDRKIHLGDNAWGERLDQNIDKSDIFLLLLSDLSKNSKEVQNELRRSRDTSLKSRIIIPIKIGNPGGLPYEMRSVVESVQHFIWNSDGDSQALINLLIGTIKNASFSVNSVQVETGIAAPKSPLFEPARTAAMALMGPDFKPLPPTDDTLFMVHQAEYLLEMFLTAMEGIVSRDTVPPPGEDEPIVLWATAVDSALAYASGPGKDKRIAESLRELRETIAETLNHVLPRLREIPREARYASWDEEDRLNRQREAEYRARGGLETSELAPEFMKGAADAFTKAIKDKRRLEDTLRQERTAFKLLLESRYASIAGRLRSLARDRGWPEGTWGFDVDFFTRPQIRQYANANDGKALAPLLKSSQSFRRPGDPFPFIYYFTFCKTPANLPSVEEDLEIAVRGTLMIPASAAHDEWRKALYDQVGLQAFAKLQIMIERSDSYRNTDAAYAQAVDRCFDIRNEKFFPADPIESRIRKIIFLAAGQKFAEALQLAVCTELDWRSEEGIAFEVARIASLAGDQSYALRCLQLRVNGTSLVALKDLEAHPDLEGLRKAHPTALTSLFKSAYRLEWQNCFFNADIVLHNDANFPVSNVIMTCAANGKSYRLECKVLAAGESFKWSDVSKNIGSKFTSYSLKHFSVESDQGSFSA